MPKIKKIIIIVAPIFVVVVLCTLYILYSADVIPLPFNIPKIGFATEDKSRVDELAEKVDYLAQEVELLKQSNIQQTENPQAVAPPESTPAPQPTPTPIQQPVSTPESTPTPTPPPPLTPTLELPVLDIYGQSGDYSYDISGAWGYDFTHNRAYRYGIRFADYSNPDTWIEYWLDGKYSTLQGIFALVYADRDTNNVASLRIYGDGTLLFTSQDHTKGTYPEDVSVDITGIKVLRIGFTQREVWTRTSWAFFEPQLIA
jgi:hypothetical protein